MVRHDRRVGISCRQSGLRRTLFWGWPAYPIHRPLRHACPLHHLIFPCTVDPRGKSNGYARGSIVELSLQVVCSRPALSRTTTSGTTVASSLASGTTAATSSGAEEVVHRRGSGVLSALRKIRDPGPSGDPSACDPSSCSCYSLIHSASVRISLLNDFLESGPASQSAGWVRALPAATGRSGLVDSQAVRSPQSRSKPPRTAVVARMAVERQYRLGGGTPLE